MRYIIITLYHILGMMCMSLFSDLFGGILKLASPLGLSSGSKSSQSDQFLMPPPPVDLSQPPVIQIGAEDDRLIGGRGKSQLLSNKLTRRPMLKMIEPNTRTTSGVKL